MAFCIFGHKWDDCICSRCGKKRDGVTIRHNYVPNIEESRRSQFFCQTYCSRCGKRESIKHSFHIMEVRCIQVCERCGKEEEIPHRYVPIENSCKLRCYHCGDITQGKHKLIWDGCKQICEYCGYVNSEHKWVQTKYGNFYHDGCVCEVCGTRNPIGVHYWIETSEGGRGNIRKCSICGETDESLAMSMTELKRKQKQDQERLERYMNMDEGARE